MKNFWPQRNADVGELRKKLADLKKVGAFPKRGNALNVALETGDRKMVSSQ